MIRHNKEKLFKCNQSDKTFSLNTNQGSYQSIHWEDASVLGMFLICNLKKKNISEHTIKRSHISVIFVTKLSHEMII